MTGVRPGGKAATGWVAAGKGVDMKFLALAVCVVVLCGFTSADTFRAERVFKTMDDDKDGFVTLTEVRVHHREFYNALDADKNGQLMLAEALGAKKAEQAFQALNADQDAHLSFEESFALEERRFNAADADKDGRVSYDEYLRHVRVARR